nr:olfactory receptor 7 [Matsumurasca onukii]
MGRIVVGEDKIFPELVRLGKTDGIIPGLILGQTSGQKDFIVHLAKTPLPAEKATKLGNDVSGDLRNIQRKSVGKINEIQDSWLVDHAIQVTRMLPGGMWVLGVFVTGPGDVFADSVSQAKLAALLQALNKGLGKNSRLYGNSPTTEKLALHLISGTNKFSCKSLDITSSGIQFRATDCKFTSGLRWHELNTQYDCDLLAPHLITAELKNQPLKKHLQNVLDIVQHGVLKALCVIDGEVKDGEATLEVTDISKNGKQIKKSEESKTYQVDLYIPSDPREPQLTMSSVEGEMKCTGVMASRVYLHQKATFAEAFKAVKEDIIRSFAARVEMHCDSLVEEEEGSPDEMMVVHEPPRRVLIPLPHSRVALSDYLFPGEGPSEALVSILDLIGVKVSESAVYKDFEGQPDQSDLYNLTTSADSQKSDESSVSSSGPSVFITLGIILATLVLVLSLFIQFYLK